MKLKKGIVLGNIDGQDFAIATGKLSNELSGIINNNETANYIFTLLQKSKLLTALFLQCLQDMTLQRKKSKRM